MSPPLMNVAAVAARRMPAIVWGHSLNAAAAGRHAGDTVAGVRARPKAGERRLMLAVGLGLLAVVGVALLLVWVRLQAVDIGYQLSTARHLAHRLEQEQRALEMEISTLTSPRRLELEARTRLDMGPPTAGQIVNVP